MKKLLASISMLFVTITISGQIPFFASTVGHQKLYAYTSAKCRPGISALETYTTFQYGIGDNMSAGMDVYTNGGDCWVGGLFRIGRQLNKWFGIGGQITPSFNLTHHLRFAYLNTALYMNGAMTENGHLFWCSNTWWCVNHGAYNTLTNWEYVGYRFTLANGHHITPMAGIIHSWEFNQDVDISAGFYYTISRWNLYLWGNDFLKKNPRLVMGVDITI